ncbi:MAG TPA: hypothetical protein VM784_07290 [Actinomycetota bacterium]|nr:hypothetical protein [Actinomycetota bacterium]
MILRDVAFGGMLTTAHPDVLTQWLPVHCFLGKSLAAANVPQWNPYVMGGIPFAADPQSGWMYLPAMSLYAALPCAAAARWFIVLQPLLAGMGLYAFLRSEGAVRSGATAGALVLAVAIAGSQLTFSLPFAGVLAWTAVTLACTSRAFAAASSRAFVGWTAAAAVAWGQIAGAHFSHGLAVGTLALAALMIARTPSLRRGALFACALPLVNLGVLLPRLSYLPRTTLGLGYDRLDALGQSLSGATASTAAPAWTPGPEWIASLATWPGVYIGAAVLLLASAAFRRGRIAWSFAAFGVICYLLSTGIMAPVARHVPFGDVYLHAPGRFSIGVVLALAVLAGLGAGAFSPRLALGAATAWAIAAVSVALDEPGALALPLAGAAACALIVRVGRSGLLPAVLAVELILGAVIGGAVSSVEAKPEVLLPRPPADVKASDYVRGGEISSILNRGDGRYLSLDRTRFTARDYRGARRRPDWGLLANQRSVIFSLEEAQGYNPVQLLRYWTFVRAAGGGALRYNAAGFSQPAPAALDLLQVNWVVAPSHARVPDARPAVTDGRWTLFRRRNRVPRASLHPGWTVVKSPERALQHVLSANPPHTAVVEADAAVSQIAGAASESAPYRRTGNGGARVRVEGDASSLLVIRNTYDSNWRATIDGRSADVLPAQYLAQGVFVPPGRHVVELTYDDPTIAVGLAGSAAALMLLGIAAAWSGSPRRRYDPRRQPGRG